MAKAAAKAEKKSASAPKKAAKAATKAAKAAVKPIAKSAAADKKAAARKAGRPFMSGAGSAQARSRDMHPLKVRQWRLLGLPPSASIFF